MGKMKKKMSSNSVDRNIMLTTGVGGECAEWFALTGQRQLVFFKPPGETQVSLMEVDICKVVSVSSVGLASCLIYFFSLISKSIKRLYFCTKKSLS